MINCSFYSTIHYKLKKSPQGLLTKQIKSALRLATGAQQFSSNMPIVGLLFKNQTIDIGSSQNFIFNKELTKPFLLGALIVKQRLQLPFAKILQMNGFFSETAKRPARGENVPNLLVSQPTPALGYITQIRTLATLPNQGLS